MSNDQSDQLSSERTGTIAQINVSGGGVPKLPIPEAVVTELGLEGDAQANPLIHGGPLRALCLFAAERIDALRAEGHPIAAGSTGENVTFAGVDWDLVTPGTVIELGDEVVIEVTSYTSPCNTQAGWFTDGDFNRLNQRVNPGWSRVYARVLRTGTIRPGDRVSVMAAEAAEARRAAPA